MAKGNNSITFDYDYQRPGGDYTSFTTSTAQECSRKCEASNHCQAFDFWESDHSCWLKDRSYPGQRRIGVISGEKKSTYSGNATAVATDMDVSYDTQRPGGDYTRFPADSAQQCAQRCVQDARCVAFDYTTVDYYCYLKTWSPPARRYRDIIYGVKRPFYPQVKSVQELLIQQHYNPGPADGLMGRQTRIALEKYPGLKVLVLSMFGDEVYYHNMIHAGAKGFVLKTSGIDELKIAISEVARGESYFSSELLRQIILKMEKGESDSKTKKFSEDILSKRELDVLEQICIGLSTNEIAEILHISPKTVRP